MLLLCKYVMHFFISASILIAKLLLISQVKLQQYNVPREIIVAVTGEHSGVTATHIKCPCCNTYKALGENRGLKNLIENLRRKLKNTPCDESTRKTFQDIISRRNRK